MERVPLPTVAEKRAAPPLDSGGLHKRFRLGKQASLALSTKTSGERIRVTDSNGKPIYISVLEKKQKSVLDHYTFMKGLKGSSGHILSESLASLKEKAAVIRNYRKFLNQPESAPRKLQTLEPSLEGGSLWVDRYQPRQFFDLLSDDRINRDLLSWVKEWDPYVFKKSFKETKLIKGGWAVKSSSKSSMGKKGTSSSDSSTKMKEATGGLDSRPEKKVVLLHGPPGIGKTTLAMVVAAHAGYEGVTMNASEDRSKSNFLPRVLDVIETRSMFSAASLRPKLLVIDEIDGVAGSEGRGAIDSLADLIDGKAIRIGTSSSTGTKYTLHRPMICICNDPWVPQLRKLRERALILRVFPPSTQSLINRLSLVAQEEKVHIESRLIQALVEVAGNDIRSCLNTLQFLSKARGKVNSEMVLQAALGSKDMTASIFNVWEKIFSRGGKKVSVFQQLRQKSDESKVKGTMSPSMKKDREDSRANEETQNLYSSIIRLGRLDHVIDGVFENYLTVRGTDPMMSNTCLATDWFEFYSMMNNMRGSDFALSFSLSKYLIGTPMAVGHLFNVPHIGSKQIRFPRDASTYKRVLREHQNLSRSYFGSLSPSFIATNSSITHLFTGPISYFLEILSPTANGISTTKLLESQHKIQSLSRLYCDLGLDWKKSKDKAISEMGDEEEDIYALSPPIGPLVTFPSIPCTINSTPAAVALTLAHSIIQERKRLILERTVGDKIVVDLNQFPANPEAIEDVSDKMDVVLTAKGDLPEEEEEKPKVIVTKDFFGRTITQTITPVKSRKAEAKKGRYPIFYKYFEGFTNAVRRNVFIEDF
eukprot:TRINITY_DN8765_c0_g1_i1.p1 TRINITY_DN8765_c0_g1~~TRINITY_DN8765_c0_g1_i1.p1  ORF type:complete len:911 (+),score=212.95 TRINITY_DN8765_c0_g1_i1:281-2734(+)